MFAPKFHPKAFAIGSNKKGEANNNYTNNIKNIEIIKLRVPFYKCRVPRKEGINRTAPVLIDRERLKNILESTA